MIFGNWSQRMRFHSRTSKADAEQEAQVSAFLITERRTDARTSRSACCGLDTFVQPDLPPRHHPPPAACD